MSFNLYSDMLKKFGELGSCLNESEVRLLIKLSWCVLEPALRSKIKSGKDWLFAMSKPGAPDVSSLHNITEFLKLINRHDLIHIIHIPKKANEEYEEKLNPNRNNADMAAGSKSDARMDSESELATSSSELPISQEIFSCNVRINIHVQYKDELSVVRNITSAKEDPVERKFDLFSQASARLHNLEVHGIGSELNFSDLNKLDTFWRNYRNGSWLEALKSGNVPSVLNLMHGEPVEMYVNVNQEDYEKGRLILMKNFEHNI